MVAAGWLCLLADVPSVVADDGSVTVRLEAESPASRARARNLLVTAGDAKTAEFDPVLEVSAWDGECCLRVDLASDELASESADLTMSERNGQACTRFATADRDHELYLRDDGNFEWNIVLKKRPVRNSITYSIKSRGLHFVYQPPLGDDSIDYELDTFGDSVVAGHLYRPDSVAGSYAVYHASRRGNRRSISGVDTLVEAYGTGKAFHIYRPRASDASKPPLSAWCDLDIDTVGGRLTLTVSEEFLRTAVYPVTVDPTIGKQTTGASTWLISSANYRGNRYEVAETIEYLDSIVWWVYDDATCGDSTSSGIYDAGSSLIDCAAIRGVTQSQRTIKFESGVMYGAAVNSGDYIWLTVFASGAHQLLYDTYITPYGGKYYSGWLAGGCSDPCGGFTWNTGNDRQISIYIVYNEVGAFAGHRRRTLIMGGS
jgi:hypothetical protein